MKLALNIRSLAALAGEWLVIAIAITAAVTAAAWWAYCAALLIVATRQHALLMLYHDAVHGLLARDRRANDILINLLVGVPHLLPVETYRPLHLAHHRHLGTADDPERRFLYAHQPWHYEPLPLLPLLRQLLGDILLINGIRTMSAWRQAGGQVILSRATFVIAAAWAAAVFVCAWLSPTATAAGLLLWFIPLLTLTNLLQKIRSFAEHSGGPEATPGWPDWTYSWCPGVVGRLTVWPHNIHLHREHHTDPTVAWHALPAQASPSAPRLPGSKLPALLFRRAAPSTRPRA